MQQRIRWGWCDGCVTVPQSRFLRSRCIACDSPNRPCPLSESRSYPTAFTDLPASWRPRAIRSCGHPLGARTTRAASDLQNPLLGRADRNAAPAIRAPDCCRVQAVWHPSRRCAPQSGTCRCNLCWSGCSDLRQLTDSTAADDPRRVPICERAVCGRMLAEASGSRGRRRGGGGSNGRSQGGGGNGGGGLRGGGGKIGGGVLAAAVRRLPAEAGGNVAERDGDGLSEAAME